MPQSHLIDFFFFKFWVVPFFLHNVSWSWNMRFSGGHIDIETFWTTQHESGSNTDLLKHWFQANIPDSYFAIWVWKASILVRVLVSSSNTFSWMEQSQRERSRWRDSSSSTHERADPSPAATDLHSHSKVVPVFNLWHLQLNPHGHLRHKRTCESVLYRSKKKIWKWVK